MVLASNEWLTNCDDEPKSTASSTANTNTQAAAAPAVAAAAAADADGSDGETSPQRPQHARDTLNSASSTTITDINESTTTGLTLAANRIDNANANNEQIEQDLQQLLAMINNSSDANRLHMMSDNLNDASPADLSIDVLKHEADVDTFNADGGANNNNHEVAEPISPSPTVMATTTSMLDYESIQNETELSNTNTNTLQAVTAEGSVLRLKVIPPPVPPTDQLLGHRITPQALNSALRSALSAAKQTELTLDLKAHNAVGLVGGGVGLGGGGGVAVIVEPADVVVMDSNGQAKIVLFCEANSHPFQTRSILLTPNIECKVGRLIAKSKAAESNAIFDCKVLSRNHAVLWYSDEGKFWVKDTKSSNGTFINENKLGTDAAELHFGDIVKFGVDVLENSRKEVHGCIIACVKLYMPDGREAISIDTNSPRMQYTGEGRISYDELHRLNLYMQEASQREKVLKAKLFNIQNILDATRKNSALCWQSMIAEDQFLHRISSLEKKLQIMDKNVPESVLRNEVLKLLEDKNSYQHTAKEALRKVYQERCDAMQMLSKMETAYAASENECKLLRDQIMNTKQSLQDVNARLLRLEGEYNEYREDTEREQLEAKESNEHRLMMLTENLRDRELECDELKLKISELLLKRADNLDDEEKLQHLAMEKLDAAIANMDLDEDDDEDDDDNDDAIDDSVGIDDNARNYNSLESEKRKKKLANQRRRNSKINASDESNDSNVVDGESSGSEKEKTEFFPKCGRKPQKEGKHKVVKESTILKWLKNSDLNEKEGSLDIFKAICNESDSSNEHEDGGGSGAGTNAQSSFRNVEEKLVLVQNYLSMMEATLAKATSNTIGATVASPSDGDDSDEELHEEDKKSSSDNDDVVPNESNASKHNSVVGVELKPDDEPAVKLLHKSLAILRDALNELSDNMMRPADSTNKEYGSVATSMSPPPAISVQTQFQNYAQHKPGNSAAKRMETQETLKASHTLKEDEYDDSEKDDDEHDCDETEATDDDYNSDATTATQRPARQLTPQEQEHRRQKELQKRTENYKQQIVRLNEKLALVESDANNTLEIMQIECDSFRDQVAALTIITDALREEKSALEHVINENRSNAMKIASSEMLEHTAIEEPMLIAPRDWKSGAATRQSAGNNAAVEEKAVARPKPKNTAAAIASASATVALATAAMSAEAMTVHAFEEQMREELEVIGSSVVQREEELIMYKERLEQTQSDNLQLRHQIDRMKDGSTSTTQLLVKNVLPYGVAVIAIVMLFVMAAYY